MFLETLQAYLKRYIQIHNSTLAKVRKGGRLINEGLIKGRVEFLEVQIGKPKKVV